MKCDSTNIPRIFHDSNKQSYFTNKSPKAFRERFRGNGDVKHKNETNNRVVTRTTSVPNNINGGYDSFPPPYAQAVNNSKYFRTRSLSAVGKGNNDDPYMERGDSVKLFNTLPKLIQNQNSEQTVLASLGKTMEHYKKSLQRNHSVKEPMMSMVPEETSLISSHGGGHSNHPSPRTQVTLMNIKEIGTYKAVGTPTAPARQRPPAKPVRRSSSYAGRIERFEEYPDNSFVRNRTRHKKLFKSCQQLPGPKAGQKVNTLPRLREQGDGAALYTSNFVNEASMAAFKKQCQSLGSLAKLPIKSTCPPTSVHYSVPVDYNSSGTSDDDGGGGTDDLEPEFIDGFSRPKTYATVYKLGKDDGVAAEENAYSQTETVQMKSHEIFPSIDAVDDQVLEVKKLHKSLPGIFSSRGNEDYSLNNFSESSPMRHWLNGWQNSSSGTAATGKMDDKQSTLSRYWTMDRSLQRRLQKTNYQHIKRLCRDRGQLFEDADFQPTNKSLFKSKKPNLHPIVWLRPHEICQRPKFIAEGATRFDVEQGENGDPWLLAAVSSLTLTPRFLDRVVPPDQTFDHGYCGVFRFRFWHFGDWVEVLIDDKLPTYKGRLIYLHSTDPSEFWAALLEKAYAKLYGTYEALHSGFTTKALQDLTGGIVQSFSLNSQDRLLTYQVLNSAVPRSTLLIASINIDGRHEKRTLRLRNGLITRHAYSVTGLARVRGQLGDRHLVRLRNPWGKGEWNGPWSERSWEWDSLAERDKELLAVRVRNEGEFWMAFEDFASQFSHLDLVHIGPDDWMSEQALHSKRPWRAVLARRRWRSGYNAGGSPSFVETTAMNPQFHIQIPRASSSGGGGGTTNRGGGGEGGGGGGGANAASSTSSGKCHVVVSVTQQYETNPHEGRKKKRNLHHIGFAVYEVPPHMTRLTPLYVAEHSPLDVTNHSVAREVVTFFTLPPGDYIVVPQTNVPNCDGKFLLRILTDEQSNIWEVNEDNVLFRNVLMEFEESFKYGYYEENDSVIASNRRFFFGSRSDSRILLNKLIQKYPPEIDAQLLQKILRGHWKAYLLQKPTLELCKSLVMLRDYNISGRLNLMEIPVLLHMLHFWRSAFVKYAGGSSGVKTSSFNLRLILWEAGITVSNKVLECLVLRFSKNKVILSESYITVMIRLHLAHERFHSIDTKRKGNPLSLEEMILMTIYS